MSRTKKSLIALLVCYLIWGLQPLYWNLLGQFDALFVLCVRIVMSVIFTWGFLICTGRLHELLAAFRNRALMKYLVPAAVFICGDWGLYNWAVMNGHVLDVSLGYYMNPMVMFVIGLALFRERGHLLEYISVGVATLGVLISTVQYGSFPIVAVLCAFSWPLYATVKKAANADPIVSIAVETTLLAPFALAATVIFFRGEGGYASVDLSGALLLLLSGVVAATPMILYTYVVNDLPFKVVGILQYTSSTITFICDILFLNETATPSKLIMFGFIVVGLIIFTAGSFKRQREALPDNGAVK